MAVGYQVFAIETFPQQETFSTTDQLTLDLNSEHSLEVSNTSLDLEARDASGYDQFAAAHDFLVHLKYPGRAQGKMFREYVTPYKFPVYLGSQAAGVGFTPFLVRTKKAVAQDFVARLNARMTGFAAKSVKVDFGILRPRCQDIRGAWFGAMREPNIASTAVFGPQVDRSDEFQHAETVGQLTNLMVPLDIDGLPHMVMFSSEGGVVLYNAYQRTGEEVAVVHAALVGILRDCLIINE